jgi:hypothetical protein
MFLLGKEDVDTDEFDTHVVVHEWGHYFESAVSRSDSPGGNHALGDLLDARLAFGEGSPSRRHLCAISWIPSSLVTRARPPRDDQLLVVVCLTQDVHGPHDVPAARTKCFEDRLPSLSADSSAAGDQRSVVVAGGPSHE